MKPNPIACAVALLASVPALAQTTSPFPPPDEDMGKYVINSGSGLDTGCTYRSGAPLIVRLKVPSPVNKTQLNADGKFPYHELITTFPIEQINDAEAASASGAVIKPVLTFE